MKKKAKVPKPAKCLVPGCNRPVKNRGLCQGCYQVAQRDVKEGKQNWDDLVKRGFALADARKGNSTLRSPLSKALAGK